MGLIARRVGTKGLVWPYQWDGFTPMNADRVITGSISGQSITTDRSMGYSPFWSAIRVLSETVAQLPLVIPSRPNAIRMQVESEMARIGCRPSIALEIDGVSAILDLVADGAGYAILSRNAVASSVKPGIYERWFRKALPSGVSLNISMSPHLEELFRVQGLPSD